MRILNLLFIILIMGNLNAQNSNSNNDTFENRRVINNKKFHVLYQEVVINKSVKEVWNEVSGNFVHSGEIASSINQSYCLSGDKKEGLGAERFLDINFQGKNIEVKERIIEYKESDNHCEFTYDVYESKGSPINVKTYNTWIVKKGADGKTYLATAFIFRTKIGFLTRIVGKQLEKSGSLRTGLLTYKHYLETGEKKVDEQKLNELYPTK